MVGKMLLANGPGSICHVMDQGVDGGILIAGDVSSVVEGKMPTISEFANNINSRHILRVPSPSFLL